MLSISEEDGCILCIFTGRMDTIASQDIMEDIRSELLNKPDKMVFDLQDVNYISSAFLRICIEAAQSLPEDSFSVINTDPMIKKTFKVAGLEEMIHVE